MIHFTNIKLCPENTAVAPLLRAPVVVLEYNNRMSYRKKMAERRKHSFIIATRYKNLVKDSEQTNSIYTRGVLNFYNCNSVKGNVS